SPRSRTRTYPFARTRQKASQSAWWSTGRPRRTWATTQPDSVGSCRLDDLGEVSRRCQRGFVLHEVPPPFTNFHITKAATQLGAAASVCAAVLLLRHSWLRA